MRRWGIRVLVVFALALSVLVCSAVAQAPEKISRIFLEGNRRVDRDSILTLIQTRTGTAYDPNMLLQDVQTLEHSKYFQSANLAVDDDPANASAKIVTFRVVERPIINDIEYNGADSISPSQFADSFKARGIDLAKGSFFNPATLAEAETAIRETLAKQGHPAVQVKVSLELLPKIGAVNLRFAVTKEPANSH